jgi:glycosyltransferase involved in cell wall biosynthesis
MIPTQTRTDGISVLVFCYNSASLIEHTLSCIARQQTARSWEIIVIDNNSKDNTIGIATIWLTKHSPVPWQVVQELRQGLTFARESALRAANHTHVLFVDDDNFLQGTDWLHTVLTLFDQHPNVGSIGGRSVGDTGETKLPVWWLRPYTFCVGTQRAEEGVFLPQKPADMLWGACLALRTEAALRAWYSFPMLLTDRTGDLATAGGDVELGCRLLLLGYQSYYCPRLVFTHFMYPKRLTDTYLLSAMRGGRVVYPVLLAYHARMQSRPVRPIQHLGKAFLYYVVHTLYGWFSYLLPKHCASYYTYFVQRVQWKEWKALWLHYKKVKEHSHALNAL